MHLHRCAHSLVCTGACLYTRVRVHVCVSVCAYMYCAGTCDTRSYRAHSVAAICTCRDGAHARAAPPSRLLAGAAPAGSGRWGGRDRARILSSALWRRPAPSPARFSSYPDVTPGPPQLCELSSRPVLPWESREIRRQPCRKKLKCFFCVSYLQSKNLQSECTVRSM